MNQTINDMIAEAMDEWAVEYIQHAKDRLTQAGRTTLSNNLYNSLSFNAAIVNGGVITLEIGFSKGSKGKDPASYYKYIDEGVAGYQNKVNTTGRFKFKNGNVPKSMAQSIQAWIATKPIQVRKSKQQSGASVIKAAERLSWAIAKNVKKTGIGKSMFWSNTFNDAGFKDLADRIEKKLGGQYRIDFSF